MFKHIGIVVKKDQKDGDISLPDSLLPILAKYTSEIFIEEGSDIKNSLLTELKTDDFLKQIDLLIVFGGDGTLLGSARNILEYETPILGINLGAVGFLTDVNIDNFELIIQDILQGNYDIEERSLVSAKFLDQILFGNQILIILK